MPKEKPAPNTDAYKRFQDLTRRLLQVSKAEVDEKRREYDEGKTKKRNDD
jgi:hypothetical protein